MSTFASTWPLFILSPLNLSANIFMVLMGEVPWVMAISLAVIVLVYILLQKHFFPPSIGRYLSRAYFLPTLPLTYLSRRKNYWTPVDDHLLVGAVPLAFLDHPKKLRELGVSTVINLCDEYSGPVGLYRQNDIRQVHLRTIDHCEPTLETIRMCMDVIEKEASKNQRVLVHCKGGNGRSAAIAFCWVMLKKTLSPKAAQEYLLARRSVRKTLYKQKSCLAFFDEISAGKRAQYL